MCTPTSYMFGLRLCYTTFLLFQFHRNSPPTSPDHTKEAVLLLHVFTTVDLLPLAAKTIIFFSFCLSVYMYVSLPR